MNHSFSILIVAASLMAAQPSFAQDADRSKAPPNAVKAVKVQRSDQNPLITFESSDTLGRNINGPSVIRVPDWVEAPLGKYYMYFAHHGGKFIRLAYADAIEGPWRIYEPGTLKLEQAQSFRGHVASPDIHVDEDRQVIRMYFHGPSKTDPAQKSGVALSKDGLNFEAADTILGNFYFRVFQWKGDYYAIAKDGNTGFGELYRSPDGLQPFESRGPFIERMRHAALLIRGNQLLVFFSRAGDAPERILVSTVDLSTDWTDWKESEPFDVISPEMDYEGIEYPNKRSRYGSAIEVRQLRDPGIFEEDGRVYLFYSIAGEMGIAMAEIEILMDDKSR